MVTSLLKVKTAVERLIDVLGEEPAKARRADILSGTTNVVREWHSPEVSTFMRNYNKLALMLHSGSMRNNFAWRASIRVDQYISDLSRRAISSRSRPQNIVSAVCGLYTEINRMISEEESFNTAALTYTPRSY